MSNIQEKITKMNTLFNLFKHEDNFKTITIECNKEEKLYISKHILKKRAPSLLKSKFYEPEEETIYFKEGHAKVILLLNAITHGIKDESCECIIPILFIAYKYDISNVTEQIISHFENHSLSIAKLEKMSFMDISILFRFKNSIRICYLDRDGNLKPEKLKKDVREVDPYFWKKISGWFIATLFE